MLTVKHKVVVLSIFRCYDVVVDVNEGQIPFYDCLLCRKNLDKFCLTVSVCLDVGTDFLGVGEIDVTVDALCESGVAYFVVSYCDDFYVGERFCCHDFVGSQGIGQPQRVVCFPDFGGKIISTVNAV